MVIVITGPIASGKSTVARALLRELAGLGIRAAVVDLDLIEDMLTADGPKADPDTWTLARRAAARLANGFLADGVAVVIADGSYNRAIDRSTFEEQLDPGAGPLYVTLQVSYEEALRRAQADPTRGVSRDPAFLGPYFAAAQTASASRPATDIVIDTGAVSAIDAAAAIARTISRPNPAFGRDEGRHVFGTVAAAYAAARPDYPDRVFEVLRDRCGLGPSSRVLEIGAGSGQATRPLAASGASVVAIEPSEAVVEQLRARLGTAPRVEIVVAAFEDVDLAPSSFDLVAVATAFHWLDPERSLPKIAAVLRPGGWLGLWWNAFGDPDLPDPFHDATEPLLRNNVQGPWAGPGRLEYGLDVAARVQEVADHGFRDVEHEAVRWTLVLDAAGARRLYSTFSNIARLPEAEREPMLDEIERIAREGFGDRVERQMVTPIYTARR